MDEDTRLVFDLFNDCIDTPFIVCGSDRLPVCKLTPYIAPFVIPPFLVSYNVKECSFSRAPHVMPDTDR